MKMCAFYMGIFFCGFGMIQGDFSDDAFVRENKAPQKIIFDKVKKTEKKLNALVKEAYQPVTNKVEVLEKEVEAAAKTTNDHNRASDIKIIQKEPIKIQQSQELEKKKDGWREWYSKQSLMVKGGLVTGAGAVVVGGAYALYEFFKGPK